MKSRKTAVAIRGVIVAAAIGAFLLFFAFLRTCSGPSPLAARLTREEIVADFESDEDRFAQIAQIFLDRQAADGTVERRLVGISSDMQTASGAAVAFSFAEEARISDFLKDRDYQSVSMETYTSGDGSGFVRYLRFTEESGWLDTARGVLLVVNGGAGRLDEAIPTLEAIKDDWYYYEYS